MEHSTDDISARRDLIIGDNAPIGSKHEQVAIIRACSADQENFTAMDFCYMMPNTPTAMNLTRALEHFENGGVATQTSKLLKKAIEHAVTTALYKDEPQQVLVASVPADKVFEAQNPGEYIYDGDDLKGAVAFRVASDGISIEAANGGEFTRAIRSFRGSSLSPAV